MTAYFLGGLALLLFIIYDLDQAGMLDRRLHRFVRPFFLAGFLLLAVPTGFVVVGSLRVLPFWTLHGIFFLGCALVFLALLLYTLFFALPFQETYVRQETAGQTVCDRGMYALCRHPGVLWFAAFYLCLWLALGGDGLLSLAVWYSALNVCYVIFQDCYTFPRIFTDYERYRRQVPFLIPTGNSVRQCLRTWRKAGDSLEI